MTLPHGRPLPKKIAIEYELPFWHRIPVYTCCWCDKMFVAMLVVDDDGAPRGWVQQSGDDIYCPFCGGRQSREG
jgi:hypothetical protein